jgi:hypothetical protein
MRLCATLAIVVSVIGALAGEGTVRIALAKSAF